MQGITYYIRDAQSNVMAVYNKTPEENLTLTEQHLYGSARLGMHTKDIDMTIPGTFNDEGTHASIRGEKSFELANHLGNVLSVITDQKLAVLGTTTISNFISEVVSYTDYYPFGALMDHGASASDRGWSGYKYGFNGKELDNEGMGGGGSTYDYGFRIYNSALGKFLSTDKLTKSYPYLSLYQYASNTPIQAIDLDGLEATKVIDHRTKTTTIIINVLYVPSSENEKGSGFSFEEILKIQAGMLEWTEMQVFCDNGTIDEQGVAYDVQIQVNFIEVTSMKEAKKLRELHKENHVILEKGGIEILPGGRSFVQSQTSHGEIRLGAAESGHNSTHELFHSIVHFSDNTPREWLLELPELGEDQGPWHYKFGGVFEYHKENPINQKNIDDALKAVPTVLEIPAMGPYTPEQQQFIDKQTNE